MEQKEKAPAAVTVTVEADTTDVEAATRKCERLIDLLKEANALILELHALASDGICLEIEIKS